MREELIQKIEEAFADVPYPGDDKIGVHLEGDVFVGQTDWQKLSPEIIFHYSSAFLDLTDEAFHFYLPAFLCAALRYPDEFQNEDRIVFSLTPNPSTYTYRSPSERAFPLFSPAQKSVIVEFLEIYPTLFPDDAYAVLENDKAELQRAIQFWKNG